VAQGIKREIRDGAMLCSKCEQWVPVENYLKRIRVTMRGPKKNRRREHVAYEAWCNSCRRAYYQRRNYRLSGAEHEALAGRLCELCGADGSKSKKGLHIDHCHDTGRVRGVLCNHCNRQIAGFEAIMKDRNLHCKVVAYLGSHTSQEPQP
jgi:hypothetical protein